MAARIVADRRMGSAVMYAPGKILYAGGGDPPTSTAEVIDLNEPAPVLADRAGHALRPAPDERHDPGRRRGAGDPRHQRPGFNDVTSPVLEAELWNPATEVLDHHGAARRVGGPITRRRCCCPTPGCCRAAAAKAGGSLSSRASARAQIFSPPYLYNADGTLAARPRIASAPVDARLRTAVHGGDHRRGVRASGNADPALFGDPCLQPEPAHLPADLHRHRRNDARGGRAARSRTWHRPDRTCCSWSTTTACRPRRRS